MIEIYNFNIWFLLLNFTILGGLLVIIFLVEFRKNYREKVNLK